MNTYTISLSSNSTQFTDYKDVIDIYDHTTATISISDVYNKIIPLYLKIDWGDGNSKIYDNDIALGTLLTETYSHEYTPSPTSLYKSLTAQVFIEFCNGDYNWFMIPLSIRTMDYYESIGDMTLKHTNVLPTSANPKEHQFTTKEGNYCIELRSS